ncbi:hypothetical protein PCANC_11828 [Puccinia coronata f. sp. avenae]|uniref:Uncharacterized protein n=1 Tax=Puccinia coronata f. sp. avenae TaxID=200324 RepID=A0A2N5T0G5_9BASI|nr:hypothetical protein PCANC_11828 [Puccinia coronata f. sp. avenae]
MDLATPMERNTETDQPEVAQFPMGSPPHGQDAHYTASKQMLLAGVRIPSGEPGRPAAAHPGDEVLPFWSYISERWELPNNGPYLLDPLLSVGNMGGSGGGEAVRSGSVAVLVLRNLLLTVGNALALLVKTLDHQGHPQRVMAMEHNAKLMSLPAG